MSHATVVPDPVDRSVQSTVRRLIVFTLLFVLVTIGAIGLSGLLARLLTVATAIAADDVAGLARSLAFTLIGGPLAAILWWVVWRRLVNQRERASLAWGLYVAGMLVVSLITASTALLRTAAALVDGDWDPDAFATGIVWAAVWLWHRWMWRHPARSPVRLATTQAVIGSVFGLVMGVGGAVTALAGLFDEAVRGTASPGAVGDSWSMFTLQAAVWAVGGAVIWWWHWYHDGALRSQSRLADIALVVVGVLGAGIVALVGCGTVLFVLLRLAFDRTEPFTELVDPLGRALAAALIGVLVWRYHRRLALGRALSARETSTLVTAGVALAAAATGIGIVVNSLLSSLGTPLVGSDLRTLLLGGISALAVGAPVWWLVWKPGTGVGPDQAKFAGRRVYLIAIFGVSAVVALITALVIGYRVFEFALDPATADSLIDRVRAPLGLLVATLLVAGYHFSAWRRDRPDTPSPAPIPARAIEVILVSGGDAESQARVIHDATGASVTVWEREPTGEDSGAAPDSDTMGEVIVGQLEGVSSARVIVLAGPGSRVEVIPLAD